MRTETVVRRILTVVKEKEAVVEHERTLIAQVKAELEKLHYTVVPMPGVAPNANSRKPGAKVAGRRGPKKYGCDVPRCGERFYESWQKAQHTRTHGRRRAS